MLFVKTWIRHKLWGGPPGPRGSPWTRSWLIPHKDLQLRGEAGQGAGRGPGGPPHNLCRWSVMGKACGARTHACRVETLSMPGVADMQIKHTTIANAADGGAQLFVAALAG